MGKKKKQFIDKKSAVTFHLVHRSQQDPLVVDENAPARVLAEVGKKPSKSTPEEVTKRKEKERQYGVYFDDDYDYLQHLRSRDEFQADLEPVESFRVEAPPARKAGKGLNLPSSVFESSVKEKVGVLNKAAPIYGPRLDVDPDIAAALDEDFDFDDPENQLEDDFVAMAMDGASGEEVGSDDGSDGDEEWSDMEDENDDNRSHAFTNYSMTSSVIRRNPGLKLIDAQFERIVETEYDDTEIGALDEDEIGGRLDPNSELLLKLADEFKAATAIQKLPPKEAVGNVGESDDEVEEMVEVIEETTDNFDCQSILSTRTNQSRFTPKLIREKNPIKINRKTGVPEGVLGSNLTAENLQRLTGLENIGKQERGVDDNMSLVSRISALSIRSKNETPEERRNRKGMVKELRRERRVEKKANTEAFKKEKQMQSRTMINVQMNCLGRKLV